VLLNLYGEAGDSRMKEYLLQRNGNLEYRLDRGKDPDSE
jgi:hypothetical protein